MNPTLLTLNPPSKKPTLSLVPPNAPPGAPQKRKRTKKSTATTPPPPIPEVPIVEEEENKFDLVPVSNDPVPTIMESEESEESEEEILAPTREEIKSMVKSLPRSNTPKLNPTHRPNTKRPREEEEAPSFLQRGKETVNQVYEYLPAKDSTIVSLGSIILAVFLKPMLQSYLTKPPTPYLTTPYEAPPLPPAPPQQLQAHQTHHTRTHHIQPDYHAFL